MTGENRRARIAAELQKGDEALRAGEELVALGLFNDAVARLYYAAFHYASAALVSIDLQVRSHRGLQSLFSSHLVKSGKLPFQRAKELKRLQSYREAADYDVDFRFDRASAEEELAVTREFVGAIRSFLAQGGFV